jgi:hypothetical protein
MQEAETVAAEATEVMDHAGGTACLEWMPLGIHLVLMVALEVRVVMEAMLPMAPMVELVDSFRLLYQRLTWIFSL